MAHDTTTDLAELTAERDRLVYSVICMENTDRLGWEGIEALGDARNRLAEVQQQLANLDGRAK